MTMIKNLRSTGGFTLIEIVIVLAIIAVLAGILAPTLTRYVGDSRIRKAEVDVQHIGGAIAMMYGDTGHWPIWVLGTATTADDDAYNILVSNDGTKPDESASLTAITGPWPTADTDDLTPQLIDNIPSYPLTGRRAWRGPYIERVLADPWGSKYMVNVEFLLPGEVGGTSPVFVLSAGPNKLVETDFDQDGPNITSAVVGSDDIIFRIK